MATNYIRGRKKQYVDKKCLDCGRRYRGLTNGAPLRYKDGKQIPQGGLCWRCKSNGEYYGYTEDDLNKQDVRE